MTEKENYISHLLMPTIVVTATLPQPGIIMVVTVFSPSFEDETAKDAVFLAMPIIVAMEATA